MLNIYDQCCAGLILFEVFCDHSGIRVQSIKKFLLSQSVNYQVIKF